jgi:protocatechuate 3,4-dioxygenase beta subunit
LPSTTNLFFYDYNVERGTNYIYYVRAFDRAGNSSTPSNKVEIKIPPLATVIYPPTNTTTTPPNNLPPTTTIEIIKPISTIVTSTLYGNISDSSGNPIVYANIKIWNSTGIYRTAASDAAGNYKLTAPAGEYSIEILLPSTRIDLIKPVDSTVGLKAGENKYLSFTIQTAPKVEKFISGQIIFPNGNSVVDAEVGAYNIDTNAWINVTVDLNGFFQIKASPGTWQLKIKPLDSSQNKWLWNEPAKEVFFSNNAISETKKIDFTVKESAIKINIKLHDESGRPITGAGVNIENTSDAASQKNIQYLKSDPNGNATFWINPGKYVVRTFSLNLDLLNPEEQIIDAISGLEKNLEFIFKRKQEARAVINGKVLLPDGKPASGSFVWGWSQGGGYTKLETDVSGNFSISSLPNDEWHIGASKVIDNIPFKAQENTVILTSLSANTSLTLVKTQIQIPPTVTVNRSTAESIVAVAESGASVYIPPKSTVSPVESNVTVTIKPDLYTPSQSNTRVVGAAYEVKIADNNGQEIKKFNKDLEITLPYTDELLKSLGTKADSLSPGYFDEDTGAWVRINDYIVNKEKKLVILRVKHLTRFALFAPADTSPPAPPAKISYTIRKTGSVLLSWANPTSDFHHAKIYRSEKKTSSGKILNDLILGSTFKDVGLKKITYYYTIKTVDAAGNESTQNKPVTINAAKTNALSKVPTGLKLNSKGEGVKLLQEILINYNYAPEGFTVSGKFDKKTESALKNFQKINKITATGSVGTKTATALNKLVK